jgi:hypothetical protein
MPISDHHEAHEEHEERYLAQSRKERQEESREHTTGTVELFEAWNRRTLNIELACALNGWNWNDWKFGTAGTMRSEVNHA